ncbi:MAG TPA: tetratricopeptide repeat protein, partial [Puia sp.]
MAMTFRFYLATILVFLTLTGSAQDITPTQADSLTTILTKSLPTKDRINALLQIASFNVHLRRISDTMLQTSRNYLHEAEQLNKKTPFPFFTERSLLVQAAIYKAQGNTEAGKSTLNKVIDLCTKSNDQALLGKAYYEMSLYYTDDFFHETMLRRIKYLQLAIAALEQTNHYFELARCYRFLADLHQMTNDNKSAFAEVTSALKYYDQIGYKDKQGAVSLLGRLYYEEGDYKQALQNELSALKIATASSQDNVNLICQINNNIGYTYLKLNEADKALLYFTQALDIARQDRDTPTVYLLAANVVDACLKINAPSKAVRFFSDITRKYAQPASMKYEGGDYGISHTYLKIYMALGEYNKANYYCDRLIQQAANPNINRYTLSLYYQLIAQYYIDTKNYEKAKVYLNKDHELVKSLKSFSGMAQNYKLQFSLDSASGKYQDAIADLIRANEVKDSIFDGTKSKQIARLEIEYETEKKQDQITLLNQKAILEETRARQANVIRNVTIAGIGLLLIIAALL